MSKARVYFSDGHWRLTFADGSGFCIALAVRSRDELLFNLGMGVAEWGDGSRPDGIRLADIEGIPDSAKPRTA